MLKSIKTTLIDTRRAANRFLCRHGLGKRTKVFGIGRNKTGTTSLQAALRDCGYRVAPTRLGEELLPHWVMKNYAPILKFCKDFDAFQDVPFSLPGTYESLDNAFPGSKFILTIRDSEDQWFQSLKNFHSKRFGTNGNVPTWDDLEQAEYRWKGYIAECQKHVYKADQLGLYDEIIYKAHYLQYNEDVRSYFANRPNDFIEINIRHPEAYSDLCNFLGIKSNQTAFPWMNQTPSN